MISGQSHLKGAFSLILLILLASTAVRAEAHERLGDVYAAFQAPKQSGDQAEHHYEQAIKLIENGRINVKSLISKRFSIGQINEAFDYALSGEGLKTILRFEN